MDAALPASTTEHFRIATTAIIWKNDGGGLKYLITKRAPHKRVHPGKWTVPGGGVTKEDFVDLPPTHPGQWYHALENALVREVREEVDVTVDDVTFLVDIVTIRDDGSLSLILSYFARYVSGEVSLNDESSDFAWVSAHEARAYDLIPGIAEELVEVDALLAQRHHG